jgi:hypothetical protein
MFLKIVKAFARRFVVHNGSHRNLHFYGVALMAGSIAAFPVAAPLSFVLGVEAEVQQSVHLFVRDEIDIAAASAVPAARTASRHVLFAPKRQAAVSAVSGLDVNPRFVDEHRKAAGLGATRRPNPDFVLLYGVHPYVFAQAATVPELHYARDRGKQSVVFAQPDVLAGLVASPALADDNGAAGHRLACKYLHAEPLRIRIPTVLRAA